MRRILSAFFCALLVFLFGCSGSGRSLKQNDLELVFSCRAEVSCQSGDYVCSFCRSGKENASLEILSGPGEGLKFLWNGNSFVQSYRGVTVQNSSCCLPEGAFPVLLTQILDCAATPGTLVSCGPCSFSGAFRGCSFTLAADSATGRLESLNAPDWNLQVSFRDFAAA